MEFENRIIGFYSLPFYGDGGNYFKSETILNINIQEFKFSVWFGFAHAGKDCMSMICFGVCLFATFTLEPSFHILVNEARITSGGLQSFCSWESILYLNQFS